jgi:hypothetical protein
VLRTLWVTSKESSPKAVDTALTYWSIPGGEGGVRQIISREEWLAARPALLLKVEDWVNRHGEFDDVKIRRSCCAE